MFSCRLNSLIKPSFEVSTSSLAATSTEDKFGISSLSCILCDEVGSTLVCHRVSSIVYCKCVAIFFVVCSCM